MILKNWRLPEWGAKVLEQAANFTLEKAKGFNPSANAWRVGRPEDLGLAEGTYSQSIAAGASTVISATAPAGQAWTFIGYVMDTDIGAGGSISLYVNGVKKQDIPSALIVNAQDHTLYDFEEMVYVKQNDKIEVHANNTSGAAVTATFFPIFIVAGEAKTLNVEPSA